VVARRAHAKRQRDAIIAWTLQCVARQPEAIAGTMLRYHQQKHDACQPDKPLIPESLGPWPAAS